MVLTPYFLFTRNKSQKNRRHDVTNTTNVCELKENKSEKHRTRMTMVGNNIHYPDDCGTPTADLLTVKLLLNNVVSTPGEIYFPVYQEFLS